jgi:drug/metabolite transporter (DMT)-like permease
MTDLTMFLVVVIWGANFSVVKGTLAQIPPLAFTALRFTIAAIALSLVLRLREGYIHVPQGGWPRLIALGLLGNTLYQIFFVFGLSMTTAANSSLIIATTPMLVALFGALLGIERLNRNIVVGVALGFTGVTLVLIGRGAALSLETLDGDVLSLLAAFCWAGYTLGVRSLGRGLSPLAITTLTMITGAPGLFLIGIPALLQADWAAVTLIGWSGLAYSALLGIVLAYVLWNNSVRKVGSSRTAIYGCAIPIVATLVAWPALGERPVPMQAVGAALVIGGVLLTRRGALATK